MGVCSIPICHSLTNTPPHTHTYAHHTQAGKSVFRQDINGWYRKLNLFVFSFAVTMPNAYVFLFLLILSPKKNLSLLRRGPLSHPLLTDMTGYLENLCVTIISTYSLRLMIIQHPRPKPLVTSSSLLLYQRAFLFQAGISMVSVFCLPPGIP